jgi:RES domain-containing protein
MELFRIAREIYSYDLVSSGLANRWNLDQQWVIYTGSSRSLATLELVVNRSAIRPNFLYKVMVISVADEDRLVTRIKEQDLPEKWRHVLEYENLQQNGSDWYNSRKSLLLRVPSAVIPKEFNFIINTRHPDFEANVALVRQEDYVWDERLLG